MRCDEGEPVGRSIPVQRAAGRCKAVRSSFRITLRSSNPNPSAGSRNAGCARYRAKDMFVSGGCRTAVKLRWYREKFALCVHETQGLFSYADPERRMVYVIR